MFYRCGAGHFLMKSASGGWNFLSWSGYQPNSARTACSFSSVEPHTRDAPNAPAATESQEEKSLPEFAAAD